MMFFYSFKRKNKMDNDVQKMVEIQQAKSQCLFFGILSLISWIFPIAGFMNAVVGIKYSVKADNTFTLVLNIIGLVLTIGNSVAGAMMNM